MAGYIQKTSLFFISFLIVHTAYGMELSNSTLAVSPKVDSNIVTVLSSDASSESLSDKKNSLLDIMHSQYKHQLSREGDTPRKRKVNKDEEARAREKDLKKRFKAYPSNLVLEYFPEFASVYDKKNEILHEFNEQVYVKRSIVGALKASRPVYELAEALYDQSKENRDPNPVRKELYKTEAQKIFHILNS